jgi:hypothetical protein
MTRAATAFLLVPTALLAAPVPPPMPGLSRLGQALRGSAVADLAAARRLQAGSPESRAAAIECYELCKEAGRKADRLLPALAKGPRAARARVARVGAEAWRLAGELGKALPHGEALAECADTPRERVEALGRVAECLVTTGRLAEARRRLAAARKELDRVGEKARPAWERWLRYLEGRAKP